MPQNWFVFVPELSLLMYLPVAFLVNRYREEKTAMTFFTISKFFLIFALLMTIVFYNQSPLMPWLKNTTYTSLFKVWVYIMSLAWFYLASKWFLNKNRSSYLFYQTGMFMLFLFSLLISARHLLVLSVIMPLLCLGVRRLILSHWDEEKVAGIARLYTFCAGWFCLLLWGGVALLFRQFKAGDYASLQQLLSESGSTDFQIMLAVSLILAAVLFMMAAAPFHSWFVDAISGCTLPVCGFLTLITPIASLFCLVALIAKAFSGLMPMLHHILLGFAVFSLLIGAFSANGQKDIRRLFAFIGVYNTGFLLFGLVNFSSTSIVSTFSFGFIYILAMLGVYTVFLGLKSKSEYLSDLEKISGLSTIRPYLAAAFLVFMFSLIGMPPLLGFLGRLSIVSILVEEGQWAEFAVLLTSFLFMANAFLNVIRTVYFEPQSNTFDRTDKTVYISLFANLVLVVISIVNPSYVLLGAESFLKGVF